MKKRRLNREGFQSVTNCNQLKLRAADALSACRPFPVGGLGAAARGWINVMFAHVIMPL